MASKKSLTDEDIEKLWTSSTFPGHFSGINTFKNCIHFYKKESVSKERLRRILHKIPNYQQHIRRNNKGPRRPYIVYRFGELVQGDLAVMWTRKGYNYFVLIVDVYTMNIFTRPLKSKLASEMKVALEDIFHNDLKLYPEKFETDQGGEFQGKVVANYYKEKNIFYKVKTGVNKASVAENGIKNIKRKLFMIMRQNLSRDWVKYLAIVTETVNLQPRPALGYLSPAQVQCPEAGPMLERAKAAHHVPKKTEPSIRIMKQNQKKFEESQSPYQVGNYVYKNFLPQAFDKSFDTQVRYTSLLIFVAAFYNNQLQYLLSPSCLR